MKELEAFESLFPCVSSSKKKAEPIPFHPSRRADFLTMSFLRRISHPYLPRNSSISGVSGLTSESDPRNHELRRRQQRL